MVHHETLYCGNPACGKFITDEFVHYSGGINLFFHYKQGCAFRAAELYPAGQLYERLSFREALDVLADKHSRAEDLRL